MTFAASITNIGTASRRRGSPTAWRQHAQTMLEFPRRQEPASFTIDKVLSKLEEVRGCS